MKNITQVAFIVMIATGILISTSCKENTVYGKGNITTKEREIAQFDKVEIDMAIDAIITVGATHSVEIKANDNLHKHIKTEISGNTLRVYCDNALTTHGDMEAIIHMPNITKLDISGAADAIINGDIKGSDFALEVHGAADVKIDELHVDKLNVLLSGASELHIDKGAVQNASYKVTGAGEVYASALETKNAKARVSGAGEMGLFVTDKLDADITGAGEIDYTGHPQVSSHITGVGSLNDKN